MAKANNWVPLIRPNTVKRILSDAGLWPDSGAEKKAHPQARHGRRNNPVRR